MLTVLEAINLSTEFLGRKKIESPRMNAELLLAHVLNCKRIDLYLSYARPLNNYETDIYREFVTRRSKSEPLQYIIGKVEFYGLEFKVNPSVLIPRQETEILVETIINSLNSKEKISILEIGTGSGNISVSLAVNLPNAFIIATDTSKSAMETAKENVISNNVSDRVKLLKHDIKYDVFFNEEFDVVVSNPPYISKEQFPKLKDELKIFEPEDALTDYSDGLSFYRQISLKADKFLKKKGRIFFEVGQGQAEDVNAILVKNNFSDISIFKDYLEINRVLSGVKI